MMLYNMIPIPTPSVNLPTPFNDVALSLSVSLRESDSSKIPPPIAAIVNPESVYSVTLPEPLVDVFAAKLASNLM